MIDAAEQIRIIAVPDDLERLLDRLKGDSIVAFACVDVSDVKISLGQLTPAPHATKVLESRTVVVSGNSNFRHYPVHSTEPEITAADSRFVFKSPGHSDGLIEESDVSWDFVVDRVSPAQAYQHAH